MNSFFIFCAKYLFLLPVFLLVVKLLIVKNKLRYTSFGVISLGLTYLFGKLLSIFYYNPRPFVVGKFTPLIEHAADNGFPSDHMLLVAGLASIGTFMDYRLGLGLWILALLIGISRIFVGVHHLLDIVGSILIAVISTYIVFKATKFKK